MRKSFLYLTVLITAGLLIWGCGGDQSGSEGNLTEDTTMTTAEDAGTATGEAEAGTEAEVPETKTQPDAKPPAKPKPVMVEVTLPESTQVHVVLVDSIDTDVHTTGQEFRGLLLAPLMADGKILFDSGAAVVGVLDSVVESGRLKTPAELMFSVRTIDGPNGPVAVNTYSIHEKKGSKTARDVALIGGGAVVGGIVGKITGKSGGTEIGAAAGAAAGAGAAAATGKDDIVHSAGTEAIFLLSEPLTVTVQK